MSPGLAEVLLFIAVLGALFLLPRLLNRGDGRGSRDRSVPGKTGLSRPWLRLALVASAAWIVVGLLLTTPWTGNLLRFVWIGLLPVAGGWAAGWVVVGFRKRQPSDRAAQDDVTVDRS